MPIRVETAAFRESLARLAQRLSFAVDASVMAGIAAAEASGKSTARFKDRTGQTRASIKGEYLGAGRGFVRFGGASRLLESGTRAHKIYGRPILRFVINGEVFFRRMVNHPGTAPRPFVSDARTAGEKAFFEAAETNIGAAIRSV